MKSDEMKSVYVSLMTKISFKCECGNRESYTILGSTKPETVHCGCGRSYKSE